MKQFKSFNILSLILVEGNGEWWRQEMTLVRGYNSFNFMMKT